MKAIILAAGIGNRLKPITDSLPKCLIEINGKTLIANYLESLNKSGISDISIVVGHLAGQVINKVTKAGFKVNFITNPEYSQANIISLYKAKGQLTDNCLLMDADVYFEPKLLERLVNSKHENCFLIDRRSKQSGEEMMLGIDNEQVMEISRHLSKKYQILGEGIGFVKLSKQAAQKLAILTEQFIINKRFCCEYEECLQKLIQAEPFGFEEVADLKWTEIDFKEDITKAQLL